MVNYQDEVAEWLRRWTANPMGSARVGSNPILVGQLLANYLPDSNNTQTHKPNLCQFYSDYGYLPVKNLQQ